MADLVITLGSSFRTQLYQDGAPVQNPTGGGDTGGGDTGGGDTGGGDTTYTYSEEIQALIDSTNYQPRTTTHSFWSDDLSSNLFDNNLTTLSPIDIQGTTFEIVTDLNTISTMDQVLSSIDGSGSTSTFTQNNSAVAKQTNDGATVVIPKNVIGDLGYENYSARHYGSNTLDGQIVTPVVLIDDDTYLGVQTGLMKTFSVYSNSGFLVFEYNVDQTPEWLTVTELTPYPVETQYALLETSPDLFPSNPADGDYVMFWGMYQNTQFQSVTYKYNANDVAMINDVALTPGSFREEVDVDPYDGQPDSGFTSTDDPSTWGDSEGDYVFITDAGMIMRIYQVQASVYNQVTGYYQASISSAGWALDYDYYGMNYSNDPGINDASISLSVNTTTPFQMGTNTSMAMILAPSKTVAENINKLTEEYSGDYHQNLVVFKVV